MARNQRIQLRPAWGWRIRHFLGTKGHVVGMLFAIIGILLLNNGLTNGVVGLALVLLLYGTGYFFASRPQHEALALSGAKDAPEIHDGLDEILATIRPRVADDIYYRVRSIRDAIVFTLETARDRDPIDPALHMVRQTATTYLPEALSTYLGLPRPYAERERIDGGRTPHDILLDQLYLMDLKVRQVAEDVVKNGSQRLVTHGRFLADRYATSELKVQDIPTPPPPRPN
jgi:hypothetical protein